MKKFDLIAFDMDGTLTRSKSPLEDNPLVDTDMSDLLSRLLAEYKIAIISGASFKQFEIQILNHLKENAVKFKNLYLLPTNGTTLCTFERGGWHCSSSNILVDKEKKEIYAAFDKMFKEVGFDVPEHVYGEIIEDRGSQITFSAFGQKAPIEIKEVWDKDHDKRQRMVSVLKNYLPDFASHIAGTTSIDVTKLGIDKAYGLKRLFEYFCLENDKVLYVGDELNLDGNDAPVLTLGIECRAVEGPEETKKIILELLK